MKRLTLLFLLLISFLMTASLQAKEPDWSDYAALLKQHVATEQRYGVQLNWASYSKIKQDPRWHRIVKQLETFSPKQLANNKEQLSFYINAYNIMAIKMVIDHWPLESIKDVGNMLWPVWKRTVGKIGGKEVTLNEIEHEILRPMGEPRIHFAIVCASISCPDLRKEPYTADTLESQLDEQVIQFFNNAKKGLKQKGNEIHTSKILAWFEEDFGGERGVKQFINNYKPLPKDASIEADLTYDWRVNGD